jgi:RNA recognition motif-containing protein
MMDYRQDEAVKRAVDFAARTTERIYSQHPELRRHESQQRTMAANLSIFNRVYVGGLHPQLREADCLRIFSLFGPIRSVQLIADQSTGGHRGYGFIDFEVPEAAELACGADGVEVGRRAMKIGRPANFPTDLPPGIPRPPANRLYIGNVNKMIVSEGQLVELLSTIGPIKACHLAPDHVATSTHSRPCHRGFGYVELSGSLTPSPPRPS